MTRRVSWVELQPGIINIGLATTQTRHSHGSWNSTLQYNTAGKSGLELRQLPKPHQHRSTFDRLRPIASRPPMFPKIQYGFGSIFEMARILPPPNHGFRQ